MNFNTEEIKVTARLAGNQVHTVKFDGIEAVDFKDGEMKALRINFSNPGGVFSHTIFPLKDGDDKDTEGLYGKNPSNLTVMMNLLRHLGNAVSPKLVEFCNNTTLLANLTWDQFRTHVVEAAKEGIGKETKIKLFSRTRTNNQTGEQYEEAVFPSYFVKYSKEGRLYFDTTFIGPNVAFTSKELDKIKKATTAVPTPVGETPNFGSSLIENKSEDFDNLDI